MEAQLVFMIIGCILLSLIAVFIPKKMKDFEIYATACFAVLFGLLVDSILAFKYKLYILDDVGVQIPALIGQVILYASSSTIVLNLYPYQKSKIYKFGFIILFAILTMIFEVFSAKFGFIIYYQWKMWYSALCYPFLIYFLVLHYRFFKLIVKRSYPSE